MKTKNRGYEGFLIAMEGIDGSGKSTQAALLQIALERLGYNCVVEKAKNNNQNNALKKFKDIFKISTDSIAFMFLYQALHRQQYERTKAMLDAGNIVIADRWNMSFFVYHNIKGELSKKPKHFLQTLNKLAFEGLDPDICCFIDVPVDIALKRRIVRGDVIASLEEESAFYKQVAKVYHELLVSKAHIVINGALSIEVVHRQILEHTLTMINKG
ncbi:MAG: dTMP kinase [Candidatus Doudnabacteria bacterium]|nr:dTMP kinase [Candidatus Doudnabacteria bacterium]